MLLGQEERIKLKDAHRLNLGKVEAIVPASSSVYIASGHGDYVKPGFLSI